MLSFENDYTIGCHPKVLQHLVDTNEEVLAGYGTDTYSERAKEKIRAAIGCPEADVFFAVGGTQTNQLVIDAMLASWGGVISPDTGHIALHETGAVELNGHKVITLPQHEGKILAEELDAFMEEFTIRNKYGELPVPGLVYISWPTEYGTIYSKAELQAIRASCDRWSLPLYIDGARLSYGLAAHECDITVQEFASLCDAFYIGGTKVGALCGEAIVFPRGNAPAYFRSSVKQHGAMLAKGRLIGVQFDALFTDDLYFEMGKHTIAMSDLLKETMRRCGCPIYLESPTNQQFTVMTRERMERISKEARLLYWDPLPDGNVVVRIAVSWSTQPEDIAVLERLLLEK